MFSLGNICHKYKVYFLNTKRKSEKKLETILNFNNHSNAEIIRIVLPSISTSRVGENAMSVRLLHESALDV